MDATGDHEIFGWRIVSLLPGHRMVSGWPMLLVGQMIQVLKWPAKRPLEWALTHKQR